MKTVFLILVLLFIILSSERGYSFLLKFHPDYAEAVKLSLLYYEAQRSGKLPTTNRIKWRDDSALNDKGVNGEDLTGGYYDGCCKLGSCYNGLRNCDIYSFCQMRTNLQNKVFEIFKKNGFFLCSGSHEKGYPVMFREHHGNQGKGASDFVKFSFTMAFTTTILSWGVISYKDAYEDAGQYSKVLEAIKWSTDYLIKCHVSTNVFYGQVGDFSVDHKFWGRPEDMNMTRPAYKIDEKHPGSDLAGEASAAFSSASIVFRNTNRNYSKELIKHAEELYRFAKDYKGLYQEVIPGAKEYYEFTSFSDELAWAAAWLFKATENPVFLTEAEKFYKNFDSSEVVNSFFYDKKLVGIQILLAETTGSEDYNQAVKSFCDTVVDKQPRTPKGLIYIDKLGTLSHAANIAFACLQVAVLPNMPSQKYVNFAKEQLDYMLGSTGRSFVVGYGQNYPKRPHHSGSSCPDMPQPCGWEQFRSTLPNPQILLGALVSGPNQNDHYEDTREEFLYNDVTLDYNAGFQSALAGLIHLQKDNLLDE